MTTVACCYLRRGRWHCLHIVDILAYSDRDYERESRGYDWQDVIDWCVKQTASQPKIRRMAYDQWYFTSQRELLSFVTTLVLKFPGCRLP